jgi:hypothetical protein
MHTSGGWWLDLILTDRASNRRLIGDWAPGIGDPSLVGWLTAVLYLVAALLCLRAARRIGASAPPPARSADGSAAAPTSLATAGVLALVGAKRRLRSLPAPLRGRAVWLGLAIVLFSLDINKLLDLQSAATELGRKLARAQGWYAISEHGPFQAAFLASVALVGLIQVRAVFMLTRDELRGMRPVLTGVVVLVCFIVARATSFHSVDELLDADLAGIRVNWMLEVGGLGFIILATVRNLLRPAGTR